MMQKPGGHLTFRPVLLLQNSTLYKKMTYSLCSFGNLYESTKNGLTSRSDYATIILYSAEYNYIHRRYINMEKTKIHPPRKHVVMCSRLVYYACQAHTVTVSLVYQGDGVYALYVSGRKVDTTSSIIAAQCWFMSQVKLIMDDMIARIVARGVYYGGQ